MSVLDGKFDGSQKLTVASGSAMEKDMALRAMSRENAQLQDELDAVRKLLDAERSERAAEAALGKLVPQIVQGLEKQNAALNAANVKLESLLAEERGERQREREEEAKHRAEDRAEEQRLRQILRDELKKALERKPAPAKAAAVPAPLPARVPADYVVTVQSRDANGDIRQLSVVPSRKTTH